MYYLYKLSVKGNPEYYIGVTQNQEIRLSQHKGAIYPLIKKIRNNKPVKAKLPAYLILAKKIAHGKNLIQLDRSILKNVKFEILMETEVLWRIRKAETEAINYCDDPNCLNTQKRSHYRPKIK